MAIIGLSQGTTPLVKRRDGAMFMSQEKSTIPCNRCNGDVYEFSVPNDIWNLTIRLDGREGDGEYICIECWFNALRKRLEQSEQVLDLLALL